MYEYTAHTIRVIDGDTVEATVDLGFEVHTRQIFRSYGINAPERYGPTRAAGEMATEHLKTMIAEGAPIRVKTVKMSRRNNEQRGKYGRYLGTLYDSSGVNLNQRMVYHGYAVSVDDRNR